MDDNLNVRGNKEMLTTTESHKEVIHSLLTDQTAKRDIYNEDKKLEFLYEIYKSGKVNEKTVRNYFVTLTNIYPTEKELDKDVSEFSFEELEKALYDLKSVGRNAVETYARILSRYLTWCGDNKLSVLAPKDFSKYIVGEDYISEKQLRFYEDQCENAQDAIILRLLFIGVNGNKSSELRNLKITDIDYENNLLTLTNTIRYNDDDTPAKNSQRTITVDDYTIALLQRAIRQRIYAKSNGQINQPDSNNISPYTELVENQYVIRPSITQNESFIKPVDKFVIYRRVAVLERTLGIKGLKPKYIQRSGMIYEAFKEVGFNDVTLDDIKIISDKFKIKSYHNLKSFITKENIEKTYKSYKS